MNSLKPYKVVKVPLKHGVCAGIQGEVLHECAAEAVARAICLETYLEDTTEHRGIYYVYEVVFWPILIQSIVGDPTKWG